MRSVSKSVFKSRDFRGAFRLAEDFRERKPTRVRKVALDVPKTLMIMGHVEFIGYRTTHGEQLVLYKHDFAPGSRPQLAAGPKRNQLFLIGGRYRVTDRGIVDLTPHGKEIDDPQHGSFLDSERETNARNPYALVFAANTAQYRVHAIGCSKAASIKRTNTHLLPVTFPTIDAARTFADEDEQSKGGEVAAFKVCPCCKEV